MSLPSDFRGCGDLLADIVNWSCVLDWEDQGWGARAAKVRVLHARGDNLMQHSLTLNGQNKDGHTVKLDEFDHAPHHRSEGKFSGVFRGDIQDAEKLIITGDSGYQGCELHVHKMSLQLHNAAAVKELIPRCLVPGDLARHAAKFVDLKRMPSVKNVEQVSIATGLDIQCDDDDGEESVWGALGSQKGETKPPRTSKGLIAQWTFCGTFRHSIPDCSGNGLHAVNHGAIPTGESASVSQASKSRVIIPASPLYSQDALTVTVWMKENGDGLTKGPILAFVPHWTVTIEAHCKAAGGNWNIAARMCGEKGSGIFPDCPSTSTSFPDGLPQDQWLFFCVTHARESGNTILWVNGKRVASKCSGHHKIGNVTEAEVGRYSEDGRTLNADLRDLFEILDGAKMTTKDGTPLTVDNLKQRDSFALYFSAHWCPPCRGFTPKLAATYTRMQEAKKNVDIIFVSSDKDEDAYLFSGIVRRGAALCGA